MLAVDCRLRVGTSGGNFRWNFYGCSIKSHDFLGSEQWCGETADAAPTRSEDEGPPCGWRSAV
jgi:hypothetical protein